MSEQPTGMDLKEFVRDVILEVIRGVNEAADNVREAHSAEALRGAVNPQSRAATRDIEFDVAITVSRETGAKLGDPRPRVERRWRYRPWGAADESRQILCSGRFPHRNL